VLLTGQAYRTLAEIKLQQGDLPGAEAEVRVASEVTRPYPTYAGEICALRMRILRQMGRTAEALDVGEECLQQMERLGLAAMGELALRLAVAEARHAAGQIDAAHAMLADTLGRLRKRVDDIPDLAARRRYLTAVPTNARLIDLAKAWLGDDAVAP